MTDRAAAAASPIRVPLRPAILAGALTSILLFMLSIDLPFVEDQEAVYAIDIRTVMRGDWLLASHTIGRKPPLFMWLAAGASWLWGGVTEVSARLPAVLAGGLLAGLMFAWTERWLGRRAALLSLLALLSMAGFLTNFSTVQTDPLLTLCMYASLAALHPFASHESAPPWRAGAGALALGAGVLSKGPLGIVLPGASIAAFIVTGRRWLRGVRWLPLIAAGAGGAAIAAAWYAAGSGAGGHGFWRMVYEENLGHFLSGQAGGTGEAARPWYFIPAHLFSASMPIAAVLPAALLALRREPDSAGRRFLLYATAPLWVVLIVFTLASSKREVYVLPALPALALLIGYFLAQVGDARLTDAASRSAFKAATVFFMVLAVLIVLIGLGGATPLALRLAASPRLHPSDRLITSLMVSPERRPMLVLIAIATLVPLVMLIAGLRRPRTAVAGAIALSLLATLAWTRWLRPAVARVRTEKYFLAQAASRFPLSSGPIVTLYEPDLQAQYYLDREITILDRTTRLEPGATVFLLYRAGQPLPAWLPAVPQTLVADANGKPGAPAIAMLAVPR